MSGGLQPFALIFMLVSMTSVTLLAVWCIWRILFGDRSRDEPS